MSRKKISLRVKAILLVSAIMLSAILTLGAVLMHQSRIATKTQINERMLDIVNTAASMLDGDVLDHLTAEDKGTAEYQAVYDTLAWFRDNINLDYIYYVRDEGSKNFTFGIDTDPEAPGEFGSPVVYTDALYAASLGTPSVDEEPYEDEWGRFYSAFSPVFNSEGKVAGVVTADFNAEWYDAQTDKNQITIFIASVVFLAISIGATVFLTHQYTREMKIIKEDLEDLAEDLDSLSSEFSEGEEKKETAPARIDDIQALSNHISELKDDLKNYISHSTTQANAMITAMASDYRAVYHVNIDENDGVCYRSDPTDKDQTPRGVHFPFLERFRYYAEKYVTDSYREGFLKFIEPDNIRESLATNPIVAYRYLAKRDEREYYEMIRMAGVRRAEERDDHTVHAIGLGLTVIDEEMRETLNKNQALAEALAMAEEANVAKTAFLSNMSHEIRTPMNAIIGLNNLALHDETLAPQTRDYLVKTGESARHLLGLINDILDMSRIESGKIVLQREDFSFSGMLEQINTMVMSQCGDKGLKYECRIIGQVDDYYIGDDMKLKEVLINILSNAIKFTEAPGSVTLTVERTAVFEDQTTLRFCIKDTGIGMDKEFIPKIFDAFSQEDSSRKNKYGSTGLGMAITKSIVEMMNGTISVESEKGVGTEFTVIITLRNSLRKGAAQKGSFDPGDLRVLIVDDEEITAEHARMVLDEVGIRADVCHDGREALQMIELQHGKQKPYNLVLMDWQMPDMNGLETTKHIRESFSSDTTVVMLTSFKWDDVAEEATEAGVDGFISKPLLASNVIENFERIAMRNNMSLFKKNQRADLTGRRVLLAEDTQVNAEIMMMILSMKGVTVDHAENGKTAVELFTASEPGAYSAILMDIRMPVMDGLEAAEAIRALDRPDAKNVPIIALTANAFDEDVQRSLQAGMNAHLTKPVETEHLYQTLEELIFEAEAKS
ncbi:MAG: response regulator [Clostridia bacterium]|nr:response regulator [Clostridia bacterium]